MPELIFVAASGLAREAAAAVEGSPHWQVAGFVDDNPALADSFVGGFPVLGDLRIVRDFPHAQFVVCAGKGVSRRSLVARLGELGVGPDRYGTVVDSSVRVPSSCRIGAGSIVLGGVVLTCDITIGGHVVVMPGVVFTHDNSISDFATLCAQVTLGGNVSVGEAAYLGMAASVRERTEVGFDSVLGMGSVLLRHLPPGQTWAGVPARPLERSV